MKKLFISQPMKGKSKEEILRVRERAIKAAKTAIGEDVEVLPSYNKDAALKMAPLACLGFSLQLLAQADVAYFAKGWDEARGCRIENTCAQEYGIETIIEDYKGLDSSAAPQNDMETDREEGGDSEDADT